jgi:transcriptional regulator with XRE-family HTH domain
MVEKRVYPRFKRPRGLPLLEKWREYRNGMTQQQLADLCDLTQGMISHLETGKSDYTGELLDALAYALGCEPADLIMRNPLDPEAPWTIWDQLSPSQRIVALKQMQALAEQRAA